FPSVPGASNRSRHTIPCLAPFGEPASEESKCILLLPGQMIPPERLRFCSNLRGIGRQDLIGSIQVFHLIKRNVLGTPTATSPSNSGGRLAAFAGVGVREVCAPPPCSGGRLSGGVGKGSSVFPWAGPFLSEVLRGNSDSHPSLPHRPHLDSAA